jgi:2-hydroxychromene-2-carboxylate isomerase
MPRARISKPPKLYFSFRSPYSWMAIERIRRSMPELFGRVTMMPYWDPDPVTEQAVRDRGAEFCYQHMSKAKHLYVLADTKRLAAGLGLPMAWPVDREPWWEVPHLGWIAARRAGLAELCYDGATFTQVTCDAGLDGQQLAAAVDDDDIRAEGTRALVTAYEDDIFGVPYGYIGRQRFWGIDRMSLFLAELSAAGRTEVTASPLEGIPAGIGIGSYDTDTAGGCG